MQDSWITIISACQKPFDCNTYPNIRYPVVHLLDRNINDLISHIWREALRDVIIVPRAILLLHIVHCRIIIKDISIIVNWSSSDRIKRIPRIRFRANTEIFTNKLDKMISNQV